MNRIARLAAVTLVAGVLAAPAFAQRGSADFSRFVALGDSYGAGVSSVGLNLKHQRWSWPAVIARQVGMNTDCTTDGPGCFQIPYISEPGILPELELQSLIPSVRIALKPGLGAPLNSGLPRPYNNMSVDGAEVSDLINGVSGDGNEGINGIIVHRNLGTPVDQVLALHPTFIAIWIGGNDALGGIGQPALMTPLAAFANSYNAMLDKLILGAPNAGMIVGTLPVSALTKLPYTALVPSVLINPATGQPFRDPAGNLVPLIADLGDGVFGQLPPGSLVHLPAASLIGTGYGIPAALKPLLPQLPNVGTPLPDQLVTTPTELAQIAERVTAYNSFIRGAAQARNIPVVDIDALFARMAVGQQIGPIAVNLGFVTGGIISLDGYHLTDLGYLLFANEYIRTINAAYDTEIPVASISQLFANNGAFFPDTAASSSVNVVGMLLTQDAYKAWTSMFSVPQRSRGRFRAIGNDGSPEQGPAHENDRQPDAASPEHY